MDAAAAAHGRIVAATGRSTGEIVELFLRFRAPVLREVATVSRRAARDAATATELLEDTFLVLDHALAAAVAAHRHVATADSRPDRDQAPGASKG